MADATGSGILAVIPAHDEAPRIGPVVAGALRAVPVVVVDDGSTDATAEVAAAAGATVLTQRPNQGKGAALRAGFRHALAAGADAVVTLDGDGQHDPAEIPRLLAARAAPTPAGASPAGASPAGASPAGASPELVIGRRSFGSMPLVRRLSNGAGTVLLSAALGRWVPDNQSGYRVLGRRLMTAMLDSRDDGFAFEVEMIAVCLREGWPIAWAPIRTIYGDERSHIRPLRHLGQFLAVTARARAISRGGQLR
ncbi:MAG: glycosyltransferase family 2 protein [Chloroflexi bacterium]|nr:glycosyltransferase family 2 protein [Chloroflexota bacterium]